MDEGEGKAMVSEMTPSPFRRFTLWKLSTAQSLAQLLLSADGCSGAFSAPVPEDRGDILFPEQFWETVLF